MARGFAHPLRAIDLPPLHRDEQSQHIVSIFVTCSVCAYCTCFSLPRSVLTPCLSLPLLRLFQNGLGRARGFAYLLRAIDLSPLHRDEQSQHIVSILVSCPFAVSFRRLQFPLPPSWLAG